MTMKKNACLTLLKLLLLTLLSFVNAAAWSQTDSHVAGHVLDADTKEHLPFINVQIQGSAIGTTTDESGHYLIKHLPAGKHTLVFSMVGYDTEEREILVTRDTTIVLNIMMRESAFELDNVVVTANKYETKQRDVATIVNVISPLMIENVNAQSMADVLNFQTGLRVEMSCSNCGSPQLRINGLEGQYSQILMDSRPIFSSLASVYGLEQVPTGMVDRIEVIRGGGSAIFGANAIAGVVNIITKEPTRNFFNLSNTTMVNDRGATDITTNMNASVMSSNHKVGLFLFGVQRNRSAYDRDRDGYSEAPLLNTTTLGFRSFFKTSDYSKITAEYHHTGEKRRGGYGIDSIQPHESPLTEQLRHQIDAASLKWDYYTADNKHFVSVYSSLQHINRDSYFGTNYNPNAYGKSRDLTSVTGAQYRFSYPCGRMGADLSVGAEYSFNDLRDQILGYHRNLHQQVHLYGGYVQNEWKSKQWSILIGGRLEKHNMLSKPVFSPRANIRYTPIEQVILRLSYANGYRAPQAYEEDLHVGAVGGEVSLITLDEGLKHESSNSVSASVDLYEQFGRWDCNLTVEGFFTQLDNVFTLVQNGHDEQGNLLLTRTNASGARVAGANLEAKVAYGRLFSLQAGYTYNYSRYIEPHQWSDDLPAQRRMFRTPDHYGYFLINVQPIHGFTISTNGKLTGQMLVPHYAGFIEADQETLTPTFFEWDAKIAYEIHLYTHKTAHSKSSHSTKHFSSAQRKGAAVPGSSCDLTSAAVAAGPDEDYSVHSPYTLEIAVGVKNMLDQFQRDIDQGMNRDASYIYGPSLPRTYFISLNLKI